MSNDEQPKETRRLAVYIPSKIKADYGFGGQVFEYPIVTVDDQSRVRNTSDSDSFGAEFADLRFRCQVSHNVNDSKPFAFSCEYRETYSVDLRAAERMVKMLRRISKAEEKFPVRPETFGQYVAMLAQALGIKATAQASSNNGRESSWHDETQHVFWSKQSDMQWLIDRQIGDFLTEHGARLAEAARR